MWSSRVVHLDNT